MTTGAEACNVRRICFAPRIMKRRNARELVLKLSSLTFAGKRPEEKDFDELFAKDSKDAGVR